MNHVSEEINYQKLFRQLCLLVAICLIGVALLTYFDCGQFNFLFGVAPALFSVHLSIKMQDSRLPYQLTWGSLLLLLIDPEKEIKKRGVLARK